MAHYQLNNGLHIAPTPAGAFYSVSSYHKNNYQRLLQSLLQFKESPLLTLQNLQQWEQPGDEDEILERIYFSQNQGWVDGLDKPLKSPQGMLENILPELLPTLSDTGKALIADSEGFSVCTQGFPEETAIKLSALSADIASLHERHQELLQNNLKLETSAWSLVDAAGNSQIGFWPMYIGEQRFVLVISGLPHLNQPTLTNLIWALSNRYGS